MCESRCQNQINFLLLTKMTSFCLSKHFLLTHKRVNGRVLILRTNVRLPPKRPFIHVRMSATVSKWKQKVSPSSGYAALCDPKCRGCPNKSLTQSSKNRYLTLDLRVNQLIIVEQTNLQVVKIKGRHRRRKAKRNRLKVLSS